MAVLNAICEVGTDRALGNHDKLHIRRVHGGHYQAQRDLSASSQSYFSNNSHYPSWNQDYLLTVPCFLSASRPRAAFPHQRQLCQQQRKQHGDYFHQTPLQSRRGAMSGHGAGSERHSLFGLHPRPPQNESSWLCQSATLTLLFFFHSLRQVWTWMG